MKKFYSILIVVCLVIGLSACTGSEQSTESADTTEVETVSFEGQFITHTSSATGGIWYPMATAMDTIWEEQLKVVPKLMPGSAEENIKAVADGSTDVAWCQSISLIDAYKGNSPFNDGKDYSSVSVIACIHPAAVQPIVLKTSDITSLEELGDKGVGFGPVGAGQDVGMTAFMEKEYGITRETLAANGGIGMNPTNSEVTQMLQDGQLDLAFMMGTYPNSTLKELEFSPGIKLISLDENKIDDFIASYPNWTKWTIPAKTYEGQTEDVLTISRFALLICKSSMDEELVYQMTKTMWENVQQVYDASSDAAAFMKIDSALVVDGVNLHPGAEKYYKEIGIL